MHEFRSRSFVDITVDRQRGKFRFQHPLQLTVQRKEAYLPEVANPAVFDGEGDAIYCCESDKTQCRPVIVAQLQLSQCRHD
jgi:hypothetical protein